MPDKEKNLTDSEIAALRAERTERDHWKWLWKTVKQLALWIAALVAGVHVLIGNVEGLWKSLRPPP